MYTISDLRAELAGVIHGTSLDKVNNLYGVFNRAARKLLSDLDAQETRRIAEVSSPIFNDVYDYPLPTDLKGNRVIDFRPQTQTNQGPQNNFSQVGIREFNAYKNDGTLNIRWNNNLKSLRASSNIGSMTVVDPISFITGNGTWSAMTDASNLVSDNLNFISGGASLKFDVSGATGYGAIVNSTLTSVDLSPKDNEGSMFYYVYIPMTPVTVTSVRLLWGSSATDYFQSIQTTQQDGTAFQQGWNLVRFNWYTATSVGTPDSSDITYAQLGVSTTAGTAYEGFRFNQLSSQLGSIYELEYYSKFLFRDVLTDAWQETVTDDTNIINLDTESYNIYFNIVAELTNQQIVGQPANFDIGYFNGAYTVDLARYVRKYPSQTMTPTFFYYKGIKRNNISQRRFYS